MFPTFWEGLGFISPPGEEWAAMRWRGMENSQKRTNDRDHTGNHSDLQGLQGAVWQLFRSEQNDVVSKTGQEKKAFLPKIRSSVNSREDPKRNSTRVMILLLTLRFGVLKNFYRSPLLKCQDLWECFPLIIKEHQDSLIVQSQVLVRAERYKTNVPKKLRARANSQPTLYCL